ncbi:hypothetical protein [Bacteroides sp. GM023]|uniref:hypothetical protein n=1 Tax=Bacteroides sp. GM023 TaxID=2723058 RepID=UPI00168AE357|nr:hypothetical protein [Bacteroides sp. GM023]MBD3588846.1 hypothetical protein [Bacteroides sp. GM023]
MKGILLILMLSCIFACSCPCYLKKDKLSTMDLLTRKSWYLTKGTSPNIINKVVFNKQSTKTLLWFKNTNPQKYPHAETKLTGSVMYYLSDSIERTFKLDRIGKKEYGNYIINENGSVIEIVKLNCDTLIIKTIYPDTAIYVGNGPLLYITKP